jgi:hypothetical protein
MSKPLPLPVWDRRGGTLFDEFMDDHPATYESRPHRSLGQWLESHPLYDWLLAAYQNTKRSARQIEPFIRKHHIDDGETAECYRLGHRLWTVNWHALQNEPRILMRNERLVSLLTTRHFGRVAFVEVGALSVGRIAQVHPTDRPFRRGAEKSVFRFGGSAVVVFGEAGAWRPAGDILEHTEQNIETLVRLGEPIAQAGGTT